ncbi:acyl-CoA dehydrogenase family protein [Nocardioides cheoyonin]|uniref:acyl-CoA dehydrogenase family protein n=1 Tax=Nocardioides cheoyonin TaxID=3156615 RepID=UPI0032B4EA61
MTQTEPQAPVAALPATTEEWLARAAEVAAVLAETAVERDRPGREPYDEVALLKGSGLPALLVPAAYGGGGQTVATALEAVRVVARADASVGQLLGYSYVNQTKLWFNGSEEQRDRWLTPTAEQRWLWGGAVNPLDDGVTLERAAGGFTAHGRRTFTTGFSVADANILSARRSDTGAAVQAVLGPDRDRITLGGDWDNLGMRLSASGSVTFDGTFVAERDLLATGDGSVGAGPSPRQTLLTPEIQTMFAHLYLGITEGALETAAAYTRETTRPWVLSGLQSAAEDPYILQTYGRLVARAKSVAALAAQVAAQLDGAIAAGDALTREQRGALAAEVAALKVVATELALDTTTRVFEVTGARATANRVGLDRFWRNARTHTLHDPVAWKEREVGAHFLTGVLAPPTLYT